MRTNSAISPALLRALDSLPGGLQTAYPAALCDGGPMSISLGASAIDEALGGGLARGALHEIYARNDADMAAAMGFALAAASRGSDGRSLLIARQDFIDTEAGALSGSGLHEMNINPNHLVVVHARDVDGVLCAAERSARCSALGGVVAALWGNSKRFSLTASRRLSLAASQSGVPVFVVRGAAHPVASAAVTRWQVAAAPSRPLAGDAPGFATFDLQLTRHRGGLAERSWRVEWHRDQHCFQDGPAAACPPLSRSLATVSGNRSPQTETGGTLIPLARTG